MKVKVGSMITGSQLTFKKNSHKSKYCFSHVTLHFKCLIAYCLLLALHRHSNGMVYSEDRPRLWLIVLYKNIIIIIIMVNR